MEKERAMQCVPSEMLHRLSALAAKLWEDRNPVSVSLNALLEEFGPQVKMLGNLLKESESDYFGRAAAAQAKYEQKESRLKKEIEDLKTQLAALENSRGEVLKKNEELKLALGARDALLADLRVKTTEDEGVLNTRYVAKMQELYEKVNTKELEMLERWEDKNKALEAKALDLENDSAARNRQLKLRERALEEDFNARKAELIKTFDRIRLDMEAREKELAAREAGRDAGQGGKL